MHKDPLSNYGFGLGLQGRKLVGVKTYCSVLPGRVKHTRLATSRVMHMNAISNTIWGKDDKFENKCEV